MTENRITSLQNPRVKAWRALKETKGRAAQRLFLAEGDHLTGEALAARAANVLLVGEGGCEKYARHMETARRQNTEICILGDHVMEALCDAKTPQGVIAVCAMPDLMAPLPPDKMKLAALDGVQDPGNVGTVLRTLDAAGFDALLIDGRTADPYGPKALRASMGAVFRVPVYAGNLPDMLERIGATHDLYAGALDGEPYFERARSHPGVCVIIGNEGAGISRAVYEVPGIKKVRLPMVGGAESLNASVAGAIMIYDIVRRGE